VAAAAATLLLGACNSQLPADGKTLPGQTYASLAGLPDWSGWWHAVDGPGGMMLYRPNRQWFLPAAQQQLDDFFTAANVTSNGEYCRPFAFVGHNGGFFEDVEFLFTPGRLTITNESGLLRRIELDGRALPSEPDETNTGTSIGRWIGSTLEIQTVALKSTALFPENAPAMPRIGKHAGVQEKLWLNEQRQLVIETVLTAPELLGSPLRYTVRYERDNGHVVREHDTCAVDDRQIDPTNGKQRFDLTPPADLPPPPVH
jgi:hypothetical protein